MIQIAIVEDENSYAKQLSTYLGIYEKEKNEKINITVFSDGDEIIENYKAQFDIILMDVEMHFMNGMTTAEIIRKTDQEVIIMFITKMPQYAIHGYKVDALDYVLKPISYFAFSQHLNRAITRLTKQVKQYLQIHSKSGIQKVALGDIFWVESQGHRLTYHTKQGEFESTTITMKSIEEKLSTNHFYRCNKGYLVNLEHVSGIRDGCAVINSRMLVISRARKQNFLKALAGYMGEVIM